jgi:glycosyltransferase involved in cell wall biosynthesis
MTSMAHALRVNHQMEISVTGLKDELWERDKAEWGPIQANCFPVVGPSFFGYSPNLRDHVANTRCDILHLHALWMYPSIVVTKESRRSNMPLVITPNGMLEPWAVRNSAWKKKLATLAYERRTLEAASCFQANTEKELTDIRNLGLRNPVCVIPNGVRLPSIVPQMNVKQQILFLGRLHPKKGVSQLLSGWSELNASEQSNWSLVIAGWDDGGHEAMLKQQVRDSGIHKSVRFVGPLFGEEKERLIRESAAFILPSMSEGLPMAVLEAWSYQLPVLMTRHCNLPEGFESKSAIEIQATVSSITVGLRQLFEMANCEREEMGSRGRQLVEKKFNWNRVSREMAAVYSWLVNGDERPTSVFV